MEQGKFVQKRHRAYCVALYYFAVRKTEALRPLRENFSLTEDAIMFDVGPRLKKTKMLKICSCEERNAVKALYCRKCGKDISAVAPTLIKKKTVTLPPLKLPYSAPYALLLKEAIENTEPGKHVFPYSARTGYNIVRRAFKYPHLFRLSRITNFFLQGWTITQVKSWTGLSLAALEFYVGIVDTIKMGDSLAKPTVEPSIVA
jgi:hypothetical protein